MSDTNSNPNSTPTTEQKLNTSSWPGKKGIHIKKSIGESEPIKPCFFQPVPPHILNFLKNKSSPHISLLSKKNPPS
jgi:hypothetical protein